MSFYRYWPTCILLTSFSSSRHEKAALQQQKADWNKIKLGIPQVVDEILEAGADIVTLFFKFVSLTWPR